MPTRFRARLSYANVMATVAVFVALGGTSYAAATITGKNVRNSSLTGSDIKNSSLTGSDVKDSSLSGRDVKDGSLSSKDFGGVLPAGPQGPKGDKGDLGPQGPAGASAPVQRFGVVTATPGETKALVAYGPFTIIGDCTVNGTDLEAGVSISTTEAGSAFAGDDKQAGSFGPATAAVDRRFEANNSSSGPPVTSDGYDDEFNAFAPSGAALSGTVASWVSKTAGQCKWHGNVVGDA